jgi:hypothetical protein
VAPLARVEFQHSRMPVQQSAELCRIHNRPPETHSCHAGLRHPPAAIIPQNRRNSQEGGWNHRGHRGSQRKYERKGKARMTKLGCLKKS